MSLLPLRAWFDAPAISGVRLSPDGAWISWLAPWEGSLNLWRAPAAGWRGASSGAELVTRERGRGVESYHWSAGGSHLIFLRDRAGDESWQLCAVELATSELRELTPARGTSARWYAASARHPRWIAAGINERDPRWHDAYRVDLHTGARELIHRNEQGLFAFVFDQELALRLAARAVPAGRELVRVAGDALSSWRAVAAEDELTTYIVGLDATATTVYWVSSAGRAHAALLASALEPGGPTGGAPGGGAGASDEAGDRVLAEVPGAELCAVVRRPEDGEPVAVVAEELAPTWLGLGDARDDVAALASALGPSLEVLGVARGARRWLVARRAPEQPPAYFVYDRDAEPRFVAGPALAQPALAGRALAPMNAAWARARDGLPLGTYTTVPPGPRPARGWPTVLWVHGGPWRRDSLQFDARHQWLADRGYAVLAVNFRGSAGLGKAFLNAGDGEWGRKMHEDLLDAVDDRVAAGIVDPARVAIAGGSYGGYAALVGMTFTPERFACGVSICGPSNLVSSQAEKPTYWAAVAELRARRIGDPRTPEGRALLAERSPLSRASAICRPLLVAHGARDPRVRRAESDQLVAAAEQRGAAVTYLVYGDEGHGLRRAPNRLSFYAVMEVFLAQHLGGRAAPLDGALDDAEVELAAGAERVAGLAEAYAARRPPARGTPEG
ncbi:MAG: prolyl oligopeptidase family serine peptidase [Kofleriaceae bacterium]